MQNIEHKVLKINDLVKQMVPDKSKKLSKALTAGYSGAAAPSDRVQGAVLQTEAIEGGRKKDFKRITCDECGFNQILAKNQVKCRKCGRAFSLEKVYQSMVD